MEQLAKLAGTGERTRCPLVATLAGSWLYRAGAHRRSGNVRGRILDHMVLELAVLHVFDQWQVEFGNVVLVHVEQDVTDHHNALFDLLPDAVELSQELLIVSHLDVLTNRLQQLNRGVLDTFVEHLTMFVEHKTVGRAVELLVRQAARLLIVNLVDGVLDRFPVLLSLGALHISIAHFVPINQELVCW